MAKPKLHYHYRRDTDVMTLEGVRYSGDFFRTIGKHGSDVGQVLQITERRDGVVELRRLYLAEPTQALLTLEGAVP